MGLAQPSLLEGVHTFQMSNACWLRCHTAGMRMDALMMCSWLDLATKETLQGVGLLWRTQRVGLDLAWVGSSVNCNPKRCDALLTVRLSLRCCSTLACSLLELLYYLQIQYCCSRKG